MNSQFTPNLGNQKEFLSQANCYAEQSHQKCQLKLPISQWHKAAMLLSNRDFFAPFPQTQSHVKSDFSPPTGGSNGGSKSKPLSVPIKVGKMIRLKWYEAVGFTIPVHR